MKFYIRVRDLYVVLVIYYFFSSILYEPQIPPPLLNWILFMRHCRGERKFFIFDMAKIIPVRYIRSN